MYLLNSIITDSKFKYQRWTNFDSKTVFKNSNYWEIVFYICSKYHHSFQCYVLSKTCIEINFNKQ